MKVSRFLIYRLEVLVSVLFMTVSMTVLANAYVIKDSMNSIHNAYVERPVRHMSLNTRVMRSNPASVMVGAVPVSSASSRWDRLRQNG